MENLKLLLTNIDLQLSLLPFIQRVILFIYLVMIPITGIIKSYRGSDYDKKFEIVLCALLWPLYIPGIIFTAICKFFAKLIRKI